MVEHGDRFSGLHQVVGGAEPRNAGADDANVNVDVLGEWRALGQRRGGGPERLVAGDGDVLRGRGAPAKNAPRPRFWGRARAPHGPAAPPSPGGCGSSGGGALSFAGLF